MHPFLAWFLSIFRKSFGNLYTYLSVRTLYTLSLKHLHYCKDLESIEKLPMFAFEISSQPVSTRVLWHAYIQPTKRMRERLNYPYRDNYAYRYTVHPLWQFGVIGRIVGNCEPDETGYHYGRTMYVCQQCWQRWRKVGKFGMYWGGMMSRWIGSLCPYWKYGGPAYWGR